MAILAFVVLIAVVIYGIVSGRKSSTFTSSEMAAFRHAEQVKKELQAVQKMIGPTKPDTSLTIGAFLPKKPDASEKK